MRSQTPSNFNSFRVRNKFLKQIERRPVSSKYCFVVPWSMKDDEFDTSKFHPRKVDYRLSFDELNRVNACNAGLEVAQIDAQL